MKYNGGVTQLVECRTFNPLAVGSTPTAPTKQKKNIMGLVLEIESCRNHFFLLKLRV